MFLVKILCIFCLVFAPVLVQAAQPVKGSVPVIVPLQPPPAGVDFDRANPLNSPPSQNEEPEKESSSSGTGEEKSAKKTLPQPNAPRDWSMFKNFFFLLLILVLVGTGVYYWRKGAK